MPGTQRRRARSSPEGTEAKKPSLKLWSVALAGLAAVTAVGIVVSVSTGTAPSPPAPGSSSRTDTASDKPHVRVVDGVPVGHPRTKAGAKAAAANFATVSGSTSFLTDESARHRAVSAMAAREAAEAAAKRADRAAEKAAGTLRGDSPKVVPEKVIARTGVLAARVLDFSAHSAAVRLWTTTVRGSAAGHTTPKAAFHGVTVNLVWESKDWKLSSSSTSRGLVAPVDDRQASDVASEFSDYTPAAADDPTASGVTGSGGFPVGYARTKRGASAAATSAVMLYGDPRFFTDEDWRHRMLEATAAPDVREAVTADADSTAKLVMKNRGLGGDARTGDGSELITRTAVLATRPVSHSDRAASVELWTASVGGLAGGSEEQRPQVAFLRMTVDLAWSGGTWRTRAVTPSEPLVPSPPESEEASSTDRFAEVGGAGNAPATS